MIALMIGIIVGLLIGWNLPQPKWAKELQEKAFGAVKTKL